jgi:hypothetical protein
MLRKAAEEQRSCLHRSGSLNNADLYDFFFIKDMLYTYLKINKFFLSVPSVTVRLGNMLCFSVKIYF